MFNRRAMGLDAWRVDMPVETFLRIVKVFDLELYDISFQKTAICFYAHVWQRRNIVYALKEAELVATTGAIAYLLRSLRKPYRLLALLISMLLWYVCSQTVLTIDIRGESEKHRQLIASTLQELGYRTPFYDKDLAEMKAKLKKRLENDIAWLEAYQEGSRYVITYTPKEFAKLQVLKQDALIAQEDGVIAQFEVSHGSKCRRVNEFVHKGEKLVDNVLLDSKGQDAKTDVEGRVYAYVWKDVRVTMPSNRLPKSLQFFDLLMEARRIASLDFRIGDKISKENILQFSTDMGKIEMVVHYTLYKDITTPR